MASNDSNSSNSSSFSTILVKLFTFCDKTIAIATTIKVIVIQDTEAKDKEKFLNTLLKESRMFLPNILK